MTTLKQYIKQALPSPQKGMSLSEYNDFNTMLSTSIASKINSGALILANDSRDIELSNVASPAINLSRYGLKNPNDIREFLLTPAGETVIHRIATTVAIERANEEERQQQIQQQIMLEERKRAFLFHWLLDEEAEARQAQFELTQLQSEQKFEMERTQKEQQSSPDSNTILSDYNIEVKKYTTKFDDLVEQEKKLIGIIFGLVTEKKSIDKKYATYNEKFKEFEKQSDKYDNYTEEQLTHAINEIEHEMETITLKIIDALEHNNDSAAREYLNEQNALNLQGACLHDMRSKLKDEKIFVDAHGNTKDVTQKDAVFVLSKEKEHILKMHESQYYLLERGEQWDDVVKNEKKMQAAQERFERVKPEIMSVKNVIQHVEKHEKEFNALRIEEANKKLSHNKSEQLLIKSQIASLNSAHTKAKKMMPQPTPVEMHTPQSTITSSITAAASMLRSSPLDPAKAPSPKPVNAKEYTENELMKLTKRNSNGFKDYKPTWMDLFQIVKTIPSQKARDEACEFVESNRPKQKAPNERELAEMLKNPPVPPVVMRSLLENMARFDLDPYALSPDAKPEKESKTPSHSH